MPDPYINPYFTLQDPAPAGSILDPTLDPEEVRRKIDELRGTPKRPPTVPPKPAGVHAPSTADLLVPITAPPGSPMAPGTGRDDYAAARAPQSTPPAGTTPATSQETHVDPATGQTVQDTQGSEFDEVQRRLKLLQSLRPDYSAEAQKYLGTPPQGAGPGIDQRKLLLAALIPGIGGMLTGGGTRGFLGSEAILGGYQAGRDKRATEDYQNTLEYRRQLGQLASSLGTQGEAQIRDVQSGVHQERMDKARMMQLQIQQQRYADQGRIAEEQIALRSFEWANPSANAQLSAKLGNMRLQETTLHNRIDEALGTGRLDQARLYQGQLMQMRQQEFGVKKQMVDIALQRATHADRNTVLQSVEGVQRMIDSITTELGTTTLDPATQQELQNELKYYTGALHTLQQAASTVTGTAATAGLTPPSQSSANVPTGKGWQDENGHIWKPDGKGGWTLVR